MFSSYIFLNLVYVLDFPSHFGTAIGAFFTLFFSFLSSFLSPVPDALLCYTDLAGEMIISFDFMAKTLLLKIGDLILLSFYLCFLQVLSNLLIHGLGFPFQFILRPFSHLSSFFETFTGYIRCFYNFE